MPAGRQGLYGYAVSKRRPVDPRQADLFEAPAPSGRDDDEPASPSEGEGPAHDPQGAGMPADPVLARPRPARVAAPAEPRAGDEIGRVQFRRVEPAGYRATDRPDAFLYSVVTRDVAERLLCRGMPRQDLPLLVERDAVAGLLAAVGAELGWSDEQPGCIVVLRVRRGEVGGDVPQALRRAG